MTHPLLARRNRTKDRLAKGEPVLGLFLLSASSLVAEACATTDLDFLLIDVEASPITRESTVHVLQALNGSEVTPLIRVANSQQDAIEHALDVGAHGVLVPKVDNAAAAAAVVRAGRFPPLGGRGVNPVRASGYFSQVREYLREANDFTLAMVQIESAEAVRNVAEIAAVPGLDVLFIGPGDLAMSLGQPGDVTGPAMDAARARVVAAARASGVAAGIFASTVELARKYIAEGFTMIAVGNDLGLLKSGVDRTLSALRER